jgi:transcriptional regulator with XRE-family HTH domain
VKAERLGDVADTVSFNAVREWLRVCARNPEGAELDALRDLVDIPSFIAKVTEGRVQVSDNQVRFDGKPIEGHIADRLMGLLREGMDIRPLARFLERLDRAVIKDVRDQFLRWVENSNLPLTDDGCIIAYKYVRENYTDGWTGTIDNKVGAAIPRLTPNAINTNRNETCAASGYHFCSFGYLSGSHDRVMLVKIAPEDVCSFPDGEIAKGRTLFYEVIGEVPMEALQARKVEQSSIATRERGTPVAPQCTREVQQASDCRARIGARLEQARRERRLSYAAVAKAVGRRSHGAAWNWAHGKTAIPDVIMPRLAALLVVSEAWLRFGAELSTPGRPSREAENWNRRQETAVADGNVQQERKNTAAR